MKNKRAEIMEINLMIWFIVEKSVKLKFIRCFLITKFNNK